MTSLQEHLGQLVRYAPPGTLVPVDSLAELLRLYSAEMDHPPPAGLSLGEVAERFARVINGQRKLPQDGTIRKWIRTGLGGVRLRAFRVGRQMRVLESDLDSFVHALSEAPAAPRGERESVVVRPGGSAQPEAELEAFLRRHRPDTRSPARAKSSGGAAARPGRPTRS